MESPRKPLMQVCVCVCVCVYSVAVGAASVLFKLNLPAY